MFKKAIQQGRSERRGEAYSLTYVDSERRENKAGGLFNIPLTGKHRAYSPDRRQLEDEQDRV